jgi:TolB protein
MLIVLAILAIAVLSAGCDGSDEPSSSAAQAATAHVDLPDGRIAFRRYLNVAQTHGALFTVNPDGTREEQLTEPPAGSVDDHPDWSPDGRLIAYERCTEGKSCQVFTVAADGGRPEKVPVRCELRPICDSAAPAWTPDGRLVLTLAQGRLRPSPEGEQWAQQSSIELIDLDSRAQRTIVALRDWTGDACYPAVSPDGRTVIHVRCNSWRSEPAGGQALYAVNLDGSDHRQITPWKLGAGDHPVFSPDGAILFRSHENDGIGQSDFWTVRPDGTRLEQLTHYEKDTLVLSTSYSPDGDWIVHATTGVNGIADLFVMRADGTGNRPVTRSEQWDSAPDWGPAEPSSDRRRNGDA